MYTLSRLRLVPYGLRSLYYTFIDLLPDIHAYKHMYSYVHISNMLHLYLNNNWRKILLLWEHTSAIGSVVNIRGIKVVS